MDKFEEWFASQDFYTNMLFIHGDGLFAKDGDVYRVLPVQMTWEVWQSRQSEFDAMTEALLNQAQLLAKKQAEVDQLKNLLEKDEHAHNLYYENANLQTLVEEKDKRIEALITTWRNQAKELCNVDDKHMREALLSCADELEVLRGEHE